MLKIDKVGSTRVDSVTVTEAGHDREAGVYRRERGKAVMKSV